MTYTDKSKEYSTKYMKDKQLRVPLNWLKEDFENRVKPAILSSGIPVSTFIKDAVNEKLIRDGLVPPNVCGIPGTVGYAIQKYLNDEKKTVLYITVDDTMYSYIKADKAGHTWESAIEGYGDKEYDSISDEGYVVEIKCK